MGAPPPGSPPPPPRAAGAGGAGARPRSAGTRAAPAPRAAAPGSLARPPASRDVQPLGDERAVLDAAEHDPVEPERPRHALAEPASAAPTRSRIEPRPIPSEPDASGAAPRPRARASASSSCRRRAAAAPRHRCRPVGLRAVAEQRRLAGSPRRARRSSAPAPTARRPRRRRLAPNLEQVGDHHVVLAEPEVMGVAELLDAAIWVRLSSSRRGSGTVVVDDLGA